MHYILATVMHKISFAELYPRHEEINDEAFS